MICVHPVGKLVENEAVIHRKILDLVSGKLSTIYTHLTQWLCTEFGDNLLIIK